MKKTIKRAKLVVTTQTIRTLEDKDLLPVAGGVYKVSMAFCVPSANGIC